MTDAALIADLRAADDAERGAAETRQRMLSLAAARLEALGVVAAEMLAELSGQVANPQPNTNRYVTAYLRERVARWRAAVTPTEAGPCPS